MKLLRNRLKWALFVMSSRFLLTFKPLFVILLIMKIKRSAPTMYFINRAFPPHKKIEILEWMARAATDPDIDPIQVRGVTGVNYRFAWSEYPESHYLWCAEYLRKRQERRRDKLPTKYEVTSKHLTRLARKHRTRVSGRDQLLAKAIRELRDGKPCDRPVHVLQLVIRVIIQEYPYLDLEKFAELLAPSLKRCKLSGDRLWSFLKKTKKGALK